MAHIIKILTRQIRPYRYHILGVVVFIILAMVMNYILTHYLASTKEGAFGNVANANMRKPDVTIDTKVAERAPVLPFATVYFFTVDWCPHCKNAKGAWSAFSDSTDGKPINGHKIMCEPVNCTDLSDDRHENAESLMNEFGIESYPSIKLRRGEDIIEYDAKISSSGLSNFVKTMV